MATAVRLDPLTGLPKVQVTGAPKPSGYVSPPPRPSSLGVEDYGILKGQAPVGGYATPSGEYAPGAAPATNPWAYTGAGAGQQQSTPSGPGGPGGYSGPAVDYKSLIANDPGFKALQAELAAGNISAAQFRKSAIQRAIIAYGMAPSTTGLDPTSAGYFNEDVDQLTKDLAAKNTAEGLSTTAQLDRAHQIALNGLRNTLAARGMLQSGATGVGVGLEEQRNKEETTGKTRELIDYLSGQAAAYAEHLHQSKLQEAQGLMSTTQAYFGMAGSFGGGGGEGGGGSSENYLGIPGARPAGNGEVKSVSSASQLDTSGGWGVQWQGPGQYTAIKGPPNAAGHSDTVWVRVPDQGGGGAAAAPSAPPPPAAPAPAAPIPGAQVLTPVGNNPLGRWGYAS